MYRGYLSSGVLDNAKLPESFSVTSSVNLKWKINIPGLGHSSPVIWDDRLFITTAVSKADREGIKIGIYGEGFPVPDSSVHDWKVICIDKNSGKILWEKTAYTGIPKIKRHPKSTHANASVATDGKYVVAFFGSEGLYCFDFYGNLVWKKDFGILKAVAFNLPSAEWEFASSPVIYNGILIIQCDVLENSFLATYDLQTGKEIWKISRDDYPCWCTPNIYQIGNKTLIAVNGYKHRGGYDFETGKEIWRMSGGGDVPIPTPVIGKDLIYFNSAHGPSSPILAVKKTAVGDITLKSDSRTNEFVAWSIPRGGSYIHSLLLYKDHLYNVNWNGTIQCYDAYTGNEIYRAKLGNSKSFIASPVAADGRIYIVDEEGTIYIISDGNSFNLIREIPLGEVCLTAPAITEGTIFFRTQNSLLAFGSGTL
ncbi:MAG: PQQ-binding-like beta-propeller repeat protein [Bacteroidales bacterium]|nr:PQQ-binding-like beta-propeller repeat protein [Bacteroidales bacterium]